jgi:hypothetical protein
MEFQYVIILLVVLLLSITVSSIIAIIILNNHLIKTRNAVDKVYNSDEFREEIKNFVIQTNQSLYKEFIRAIADSNENLEKLKNLESLTSKILNDSNETSNFDPDKIDKILNDIIKRITAIEKRPERNLPLEVKLIPEDFYNLIKRDTEIKTKIQELLDIVVLRDVILKMVPVNLEVNKFFELENDAVKRYWEYYLNNKDYLPAIINKLKKS